MTFVKRLIQTAVVVATAATLAGCGINTIPTNEERARAAWGDVQNQYQRRADLVPNLVATVQGAAIAERTTLTQVIEARARATSINVDANTIQNPQQFQQYAAAQGELSQALGRLLLVVERYPEVRSNQNFVALQSQLEGTENQVAVARNDYNEAARAYNTSLRTFPTVIWANTIHSGSEPMQYFQAAGDAQRAPTVNFDGLNPNAAQPGAAPPPAAPAPAQ